MTATTLTTACSAAQDLKARRQDLFAGLTSLAAPAFLKAHAELLDRYFLACLSKSAIGAGLKAGQHPCALIAVGGYGRAEQCVHSDIDLLFLFETEVPAAAGGLVEEIAYPLWDQGLEVGHAVRSIDECLELAAQDIEVLTALLDARLVCGSAPLQQQLRARLRAELIDREPGRIIDRLVETNLARHRRFGDCAYLLEPNLKEGQGGLRDYHTMLWTARIQSGIEQVRDLEYYGYLSHREYEALTDSLAFVWNVRNHLHLLMGRKCDQLYLDHQARLAAAMEIQSDSGHVPVEVLLGDLHAHMEQIKQCYRIFFYELEQKKRRKRKVTVLKESRAVGLKLNRGLLGFVSTESIVANPRLLVQIFVESVLRKTPLSAEARRVIREFGYLVEDDAFRNSPEVVAAFEKVLTRRTQKFHALSAMLETGFLERFIPQFKAVVNRIQFDQYHLYPVGRHLLLTVQLLKNFGLRGEEGQDALASKLYNELRNRKVLLWAALLHDIGKAEPTTGHAERGAQMAGTILTAKNLSPADVDTAVFLVREHLLLFETATRRDINDEETALYVARRVGRPLRLKMLYLLSLADAMATGPKAWNEWTASLMRNLFLKTHNVLKKGGLVSRRALRVMEEKKQGIIAACDTGAESEAVAALIPFMSPRYLLNTPLQEIRPHAALYRRLGERQFVWNVEPSADGETRTVTLCAKDRPGLLSKVAGVLTLGGIDILDVRIFTWRNNIALDIFEVQPPPDPIYEEERWQRTALQLKAALEGQLDLTAEVARKLDNFRSLKSQSRARPQTVKIDNETSSFFTIIEVAAWDFPGLLYRITDALFRCRLDIWVAKIATYVDQVVDVFYVRNFEGEKVDRPEEVQAVRQALAAVLDLSLSSS